MPNAHPPVAKALSSALRAVYDAAANEPLPERWVDLINRLNEEERMHREGLQAQTQPPPKQN